MRWRGNTPHVSDMESVMIMPLERDDHPDRKKEALLEAQSLVTHLQGTAETDKAALARLLHDELGTLMVSALMDLSSLQHLQADMGEVARQRLERAKDSLRTAIDLK